MISTFDELDRLIARCGASGVKLIMLRHSAGLKDGVYPLTVDHIEYHKPQPERPPNAPIQA